MMQAMYAKCCDAAANQRGHAFSEQQLGPVHQCNRLMASVKGGRGSSAMMGQKDRISTDTDTAVSTAVQLVTGERRLMH
jgi:hypothetical protein